VSEPQLATSTVVPKLKNGLRITPFHDGTTTEERYLVEVGEIFFVAGKPMRDVLIALAEEPKTLEELAAAYERQTGHDISTEVLADVLANRISDSLFDHTPEPKNTRPFIFSFNLFSEALVRPFSSALAVLYTKRSLKRLKLIIKGRLFFASGVWSNNESEMRLANTSASTSVEISCPVWRS